MAEELREGTHMAHRRGWRDFLRYALASGERPFPCSTETLLNYGAYSLKVRRPTLDSTTLGSYVGGVSVVHQTAARELGVALVDLTKTGAWRRLLRVAHQRFKKESKAALPW